MEKSRAEKLAEGLVRLGRQAKQGATFSLADEAQDVAGGLAASLYSQFTDNKMSPKEAIALARELSQKELAKDWEESPVTSFAGQVAGGIPLGLTKAGVTATNWIRNSGSALQGIGRGAAVGAGFGSAAGLGAAGDTLGERASGFGLGAGTGAVLGGATAPLARMGQQPNAPDFRKVADRAAKTVTNKAEQELARQLAARPDLAAQLSRAESMNAAAGRTGIPLTLAEMVAQTTNDPLLTNQTVLATNPMTAGRMAEMYAARSGTPQQAGQIEQSLIRLAQQLDPSVGSYDEAARSLISAGDEAQRGITQKLTRQAQPLYQQAYQATVSADDPVLKNPLIQSTLNRVRSNPVFAQEIGNAADNSIQALDAVKRSLDDMAEAANRTGNRNEARLIQNARTQLLGAMDNASPEYGQARGIYSGNPEALQMRQSIGGLADIDPMDARSVNRALFGGTQQNANIAAQALGDKAPTAAAARIYDAMDAARGDPVTLAGRIAPDQRTSDMLRSYAGGNADQIDETINVINQAKIGEKARNSSFTFEKNKASEGLETAANAAIDVATGGKTTLLRRVANMFTRGDEKADPQFYADMADLMLTPKGLDLVRRVASGQQQAIQELQSVGLPSLNAGALGRSTTTLPVGRAGIAALMAPETQTPMLNAATQQDFSDIEAILRSNAPVQKQQDFSDIEKILQGVR